MVIDLHAKNQVNICKGLGKKVRKTDSDGLTDGRTDGLTDRRTERKHKLPFGFAGRGLKSAHFLFGTEYFFIFQLREYPCNITHDIFF